MRVCLLTTSYPRFPGDYAGVFVFDLATWLVKKGIEVAVVAPHEVGLPRQEIMGGIQVNRFAYMIPSRWQRIAYLGGIPSNLRKYWLAWLQLPAFSLSFYRAGRKVCRDCDIIHAYWMYSGFIAARLAAACSKPAVLTVQGSDVNLLYDNRTMQRLRRHVIARLDKIIAVSSPLAERIRALGADADKVTLIPNGVDPGAFSHHCTGREFSYRMLWVGRMSSEKGIENLIKALSQVALRFPQAVLTLVGDGPLRPELEALIRGLGLADRVELTGMLPHEAIPEYLAATDLFVLPSLSEGLPLVLVEAMSAGKPVVATRVGGIPDVLVDSDEQRTGYLVPAGDPDALAQAIITVLSSPERARFMGQNGRRRVENHYSWSTIAAQTAAVYGSLL